MATATVPVLDLSALLKGLPRGAWVAISNDRQRVVAFGAEVPDVVQEAKSKGEPNPIIVRVPKTAGALLL
jgi:hypothetical protein